MSGNNDIRQKYITSAPSPTPISAGSAGSTALWVGLAASIVTLIVAVASFTTCIENDRHRIDDLEKKTRQLEGDATRETEQLSALRADHELTKTQADHTQQQLDTVFQLLAKAFEKPVGQADPAPVPTSTVLGADAGSVSGKLGIIGEEFGGRPMYCGNVQGVPPLYDPESNAVAIAGPLLINGRSLCGRMVKITVQQSDGTVTQEDGVISDIFSPVPQADLTSPVANKFNVSRLLASKLGIKGLTDAIIQIPAENK